MICRKNAEKALEMQAQETAKKEVKKAVDELGNVKGTLEQIKQATEVAGWVEVATVAAGDGDVRLETVERGHVWWLFGRGSLHTRHNRTKNVLF